MSRSLRTLLSRHHFFLFAKLPRILGVGAMRFDFMELLFGDVLWLLDIEVFAAPSHKQNALAIPAGVSINFAWNIVRGLFSSEVNLPRTVRNGLIVWSWILAFQLYL